MINRLSITIKLTLLFSVASTAVLLSLGLLIGHSVEQHFEEQDMEVLTETLGITQNALEKTHSKSDIERLSRQLDEPMTRHHGLVMMVTTLDGNLLSATSGANFPRILFDQHVSKKPTHLSVWKSLNNHPLRGISATSKTGIPESPEVIVAVATDISHHEHFMHSFQNTLWSFVSLAAIITGVLGGIAVRRGLAPLKRIKQEAAAITAHRLDARLPTDLIPVELAELTDVLNQMLARLEDSFQRLSDFSSDLAHELRTPVSNLLTQTQVTLSKARTADEYCDVLASNAEEFERLSRMISDMLFLAKSENSLIIPTQETVNLAVEVTALFEFYEALADEKEIRLHLSGTSVVSGDKLLLRRALSNVLTNAIRHSEIGGDVSVTIEHSANAFTTVSITNLGATIPPEHLPRLFDRFYRVDPSRQRFSEGAGLGLAITRSIMKAHHGDALIRSENGATVVELLIPTQPS